MRKTINAFIQKDNSGEWLALPATREEFQKIIRKIDAASSADITVERCTTEIDAIPIELITNAALNHINFLASRLSDMNGEQIEKLNAIMQSPFRFSTMAQLIDYTYNNDFFLFRRAITDNTALGKYYVFETGLCQMPEEWKGGIDLECFGAHAAKQEKGVFTSAGYLMPSGDEWQGIFTEKSIPDKYRLIT